MLTSSLETILVTRDDKNQGSLQFSDFPPFWVSVKKLVSGQQVCYSIDISDDIILNWRVCDCFVNVALFMLEVIKVLVDDSDFKILKYDALYKDH